MAATWRSGAKWGSSLTWRGSAAAYRNESAYRTAELDYRGNLPAGGGTTQETTASLTVTVATEATATSVRVQETTASLTVAPATAATAGASDKSTTATLTPTPATSADATRVQDTTGGLTLSPATSATATAAYGATAALDPTPTTSATGVREQPTTASLTITPATSADGEAYKATANDGTAATDVSTSWADEALAYDDDPLTYATASGVGTHVLDITGYDFGSIVGATDDLVSVTVNVSQYVSDGGRFAAPTVQAFDGSTGIGSPIALLERTTAGSEDVTISGITLAQVRSAGFKIRYSVEQTS